MQFEAKLTLDGLMTLAAGIIAFAAVIIQIRSSSKQVRQQIKAQQDADREEQEQQRHAIATALLFEIDSFYMIELEQVEKTLSSRSSNSTILPSAMGLRSNITEVYKAVSPMLGSLNAKSVSAIIKFYSMVGLYEGLWRNYQYNLDRLFQSGPPQEVLDAFTNNAKEDLETIRVLIPQLKELATNVSVSVARDCGLDELIAKNNAKTH